MQRSQNKACYTQCGPSSFFLCQLEGSCHLCEAMDSIILLHHIVLNEAGRWQNTVGLVKLVCNYNGSICNAGKQVACKITLVPV